MPRTAQRAPGGGNGARAARRMDPGGRAGKSPDVCRVKALSGRCAPIWVVPQEFSLLSLVLGREASFISAAPLPRMFIIISTSYRKENHYGVQIFRTRPDPEALRDPRDLQICRRPDVHLALRGQPGAGSLPGEAARRDLRKADGGEPDPRAAVQHDRGLHAAARPPARLHAGKAQHRPRFRRHPDHERRPADHGPVHEVHPERGRNRADRSAELHRHAERLPTARSSSASRWTRTA